MDGRLFITMDSVSTGGGGLPGPTVSATFVFVADPSGPNPASFSDIGGQSSVSIGIGTSPEDMRYAVYDDIRSQLLTIFALAAIDLSVVRVN